jgi:GLPGLI family protein
MKKIIFFIIILTSLKNFSQEKIISQLEIQYKIHYNTEIPNTKEGTLYIDNKFNKSLFIYGKNKKRKIEENRDNNNFKIQFAGSIRFNYVNFKSDSIYSKEKVFNEEFIIAENIKDFNWNLEDESKKIDNLLVKKATLNFRGRNYIAWYTEKYPVKFGPWKFQNLPGLIIEIYDETKRYHWIATSFSNKENVINFSKMKKDLKKISLKKFVEKRYNKNLSLFNNSKLPRGTIINKRKIKRNGIETKFEWEEEKTKKD